MNQKVEELDEKIVETHKEKKAGRVVKTFLPTEVEELKAFLTTLMSCGAHFGHPSIHPTSVTLAIDKTNGCNIIDLKYTIKALGEVLNRIYHIISDGGKILFVNTSNLSELFKKTATETGQAFIAGTRYRPGLLTNFKQFLTQIRNLERAEKQLELESSLNIITKKEKRVKSKQFQKVSNYFEGLGGLKELPKMVIVVGNSKEYEILKKETEKMHIYFVSISDVNIEYLKVASQTSIPCNTQSKETVELILRYISQAILEGYEHYMHTAKKHHIKSPVEKPAFRKKSQKEIEEKMVADILNPNQAVEEKKVQ